MRVYQYTSLEELNKALEQFELNNLHVLAVKIFHRFSTPLSQDVSFFVIVDKKISSKRFEKDV